MRHKTALVFSGIVTALAMVVVIGLFGLSARQAKTAQAPPGAQGGGAIVVSQTGQLSTDVATLQAQVVADQQQLQVAYLALQQAYDEIQMLSATGGSRGFRNRGGSGQFQFNNGGVGDD
jgi:hypothetical protein